MAWGAVAGGLLSLAGQAFGAGSQGNMNKKNREFAREQELLQHGRTMDYWHMQNDYDQRMMWDERNYNLALWNTQNEYAEKTWNKQNLYNEGRYNIENQYNSPMAQMQRFKEAGLNPNLIYGQSNTGGSISAANLSPDRIASSNRPANPIGRPGKAEWRGVAPQLDLKDGIMAYAALKEQGARTNNLEAQNKVLVQDAALRAAQTSEVVSRNAKTQFELGLASQLRQTSVDAAEASLRKVQIESDISLRRDERDAALNSSNLREAAERIQNMRGQRQNMQLDNELKQMDIQLKRLGIQPTDNIIFRILGRALGNPDVRNGLGELVNPELDGSYKLK